MTYEFTSINRILEGEGLADDGSMTVEDLKVLVHDETFSCSPLWTSSDGGSASFMSGVLDKSLGCMEFGGSLGEPCRRQELSGWMGLILRSVASSRKEVVRQNCSLNLVSVLVHDLSEDSHILSLVAGGESIFFGIGEVGSHISEGAVDEKGVEIMIVWFGPMVVRRSCSEALEDLTKTGFVDIVSIDPDVGFGDGNAVGREERIDL